MKQNNAIEKDGLWVDYYQPCNNQSLTVQSRGAMKIYQVWGILDEVIIRENSLFFSLSSFSMKVVSIFKPNIHLE